MQRSRSRGNCRYTLCAYISWQLQSSKQEYLSVSCKVLKRIVRILTGTQVQYDTNGWLNDTIMDASQAILRKHFQINRVCAYPAKPDLQAVSKQFVQTINKHPNDGGLHSQISIAIVNLIVAVIHIFLLLQKEPLQIPNLKSL